MADVNNLTPQQQLDLLVVDGDEEISAQDARDIVGSINAGSAASDISAIPGTDTIQAAHDSLGGNGGRIILSAGLYIITTTILITKSNVKIVGSGLATIIDITGALIGFSVSGSRFHLAHVKVQLNNAVGGVVGVDITAGTDSVIENVEFENTQAANAAYVRSTATRTQIIGCHAVLVTGSITNGILITTGATNASIERTIIQGSAGFNIEEADALIDRCKVLGDVGRSIDLSGPRCVVRGCHLGAGSRGIFLDAGADNCVISDCVLTLPANATNILGIDIRPGADDVTISGCQIDGTGNTNLFTGGINNTALRTILRGNHIRNLLAVGISGVGNDAVIVDNVIELCQKGIQMTVALRLLIANNKCRNNSLDGIQIKQCSDRSLINGNHCHNNGRTGIGVQTTDECNIIGNHCHSNGTDGINELAGNFNAFRNNHLRGNGGSPIVIVGASSVGTDNFT